MVLNLEPNKEQFLDEARVKVSSFQEELISAAWDFAKTAHVGQSRLSGESYFTHPVGVAKLLLLIDCDSSTIAAALLHDVAEDTPFSIKKIEENFGLDVASLVEGVTKLSPLDESRKAWTREDFQRENLRKLVIAIVSDPRVALIKLADRIYNLSSLGAMSTLEKAVAEEKKRRIASESLAVFAPIAEAMGLGVFQARIEDLAFRFLEPEIYDELRKKLEAKEEEFTIIREEAIAHINNSLVEAGILNAVVFGRQKEIYSTYRKMRGLSLNFEEVYDIIGIRIIVDTPIQCYTANSIVDDLGVVKKYDDYIRRPRGILGYQSLHKIIRHPLGPLFEVQIRTADMNEKAERGDAAHWIYKLGGTTPDPKVVVKIKNFRKWLQGLVEDKEFSLEGLLEEGLGPQIYVFTPNKDPIFLPEGSTALDFAYYIHSDVGNQAVGVLVNNESKPFEYVLNEGDTVKVFTHPASTPKLSWISDEKVTSRRAKDKIRHYFHSQKRSQLIEHGKETLQKYLDSQKDLQITKKDLLDNLAKNKIFSEPIEENLYVAYADGRFSLERINRIIGEIVVQRCFRDAGIKKEALPHFIKWISSTPLDQRKQEEVLFDAPIAPKKREETFYLAVAQHQIAFKNLKEAVRKFAAKPPEEQNIATLQGLPKTQAARPTTLLAYLAKCCRPMPDDPFVALVTKGKGLALHRNTCPQVLTQGNSKPLDSSYTWESLGFSREGKFIGEIMITLAWLDSKFYKDINQIVVKADAIICEQKLLNSSRLPPRISLIIEVKNASSLQSVVLKLKQNKNIIKASRVGDDENNF